MRVTGTPIAYLAASSFLLIGMVIIIDMCKTDPEMSARWRRFKERILGQREQPGTQRRSPESLSFYEKEDEDVRAEREKVVKMEKQRGESDPERGEVVEDSLVLFGLRKVFAPRTNRFRMTGGKVAVRDLYFSVPAGQCFG